MKVIARLKTDQDGRVIIPPEALNLKPGEEVVLCIEDGKIVLKTQVMIEIKRILEEFAEDVRKKSITEKELLETAKKIRQGES